MSILKNNSLYFRRFFNSLVSGLCPGKEETLRIDLMEFFSEGGTIRIGLSGDDKSRTTPGGTRIRKYLKGGMGELSLQILEAIPGWSLVE